MKKTTLEEKIRQVGIWTFGGIFWYLVIAFFLKSNYPIYEYDFNRSVAYEVIKDALTLGAAFLAPVAAFVLFTDWKEQHRLIKNEVKIEEILLGIDSVDRKIKRFLNTSLNIKADAILLENLVPLKPEIIKCSEDINELFLQLRFFYFQTGDKELQDVCNNLLIKIVSIITQYKMCLDQHEAVMNSSNEEGYGKDFLEASKTLLLGSTKTYWGQSEKIVNRINSLSEKYIIKS